MTNSETIKKKAIQKGADICGVAPLHLFPSLPLIPMTIGIQKEIMEGVYFP